MVSSKRGSVCRLYENEFQKMCLLQRTVKIMAETSTPKDKEDEELLNQVKNKTKELKHAAKFSRLSEKTGKHLEMTLKRLSCKLTLCSLDPEDVAPELCFLEEAMKKGDEELVKKIIDRLDEKFSASRCTIQGGHCHKT